MKKVSAIFVATLLIEVAGMSVLAQNGVVSPDYVTFSLSDNALQAGMTHEIFIRYNFTGSPSSPLSSWYGSNGFEIYSPDGANWVSFTGTNGPLVNSLTGTAKYNKHFNFDGTNWTVTGNGGSNPAGGSTGVSSRAGFYLATVNLMLINGYEAGIDNDIALSLRFQSLMSDTGKTICVDTCAAIVAWEWSNGDEDFPVWDNGLGVNGPRCWTVGLCPNCCSEWCMCFGEECGDNVYYPYCDTPSYTLCAHPYCQYVPVEYYMLPPYDNGDYGYVDTHSGMWTWPNPQLAPGTSVDIQFQNNGYSISPFTLHVTATGCDCCAGRVGDANGSGEDEPTVGDISALIDHLFISSSQLICIEEADVNQSGGATPFDEDVTIGDVSALIDYLFITGAEHGILPNCM